MTTAVEYTRTGHCGHGDHGQCDGLILLGTGFNWYCTCSCHPKPTPPDGPDGAKALEFWRSHRCA